MTSKQIFGILLLIGGTAVILYGFSIQNSIEYEFASAFGGDTSRVVLLMAGGVIAAIAGLLLLIFGRRSERTEQNVTHVSAEQSSSNNSTDICLLDDSRLEDIMNNSASYRPEIVEASRRELQIRRKCNELIPQVREKDDKQLQEIVGNPGLYTEELIRSARIVQEERRQVWLEEQERAERQARMEQEKLAEERRLLRIAARKKRRPYVYSLLAVVVLGAIGAGYYAYRQKQERLAMEQRAAEERRIAELKRAEEERAAKERWAEAQRQAEEKRKQAEEKARAERQRKAEEQAKADRERRAAGFYRIGELYDRNGLRGIVFRTDETGAHGKLLSLDQEELTYFGAKNKIYHAEYKFRLPSEEDMWAINEHLATLNKGLKSAGGIPISSKRPGYWLDHEDGYYSHWFIPGDNKMHRSLSISDNPDTSYARWVYEY